MDTKEHRRRRPAQQPERAGRSRPADRKRSARTPETPERSQSVQRQKRAAAGTDSPRRQRTAERPRPKTSARKQERRVVRAPEHNVPQVSYSMPRPFSRSRFLLKIGTAVAVVIAILACLSLFFRVNKITVSGTEKYTPFAIREASGISEGDSLLGISEPRTAGRIIHSLPYVKDVKIIRNLPDTVRIVVRELDVTYAIEASDGSWWLIASDGRVVDSIDSTAVSGYMKIVGVRAETPAIGQTVRASAAPVPSSPEETGETEQPTETEDPDATQETVLSSGPDGLTLPTVRQQTDADRLQAALSILDQLERNAVIGKVVSVDVTSLDELTLEYGKRFHVVIGTPEKLGYKIAAMTAAVEQLEEYEIGELDVSFQFSEKVIFDPQS